MNNSVLRFFEHLRHDTLHGLRGIARNPGFAAVVVLTLGLGIGANTAIFSIVHGVLMRPLPYKAPHRLVLLQQAAPKIGENSFGFSVPDFTDFREKTGVVSDNFFDTLGVKPLLGRAFLPGEDKQGAAPVLLLSYNFWQNSFA